MTSLRGIDGQVYAIAQGPWSPAGLSRAGAATSRRSIIPPWAALPMAPL